MSLFHKLIRQGLQLLPSSLSSLVPLRFKSRLGYPLDRWDYQKLFWRNWFAYEGGQFGDDYVSRTDSSLREDVFPAFLHDYLRDLNQAFAGEEILVLDVGSGPISVLAWGHEEGLFRLTCVDPLAQEYHRLLHNYGVSAPTEILAAYGEELAYSEEFHMVFSRNALDHCVSPSRTFRNMVEAVKRGGYIVICTAVDEGSAEKWSGGHQWNLDLKDDDLKLTSRQGETVVLSDSPTVEHVWSRRTHVPPPQRGWVDVVYRRSSQTSLEV